MKGEQVIGCANLARAVALKGQTGIGIAHPHPIVDDLYQGAARILEDNLDMGSLSVNGILYQFLDDAGRSLDDFTGGNLIGYRIGQQFNHIAHGLSSVLGVDNSFDTSAASVALATVPALLPERRRVPPWMDCMSCLSSSLTS